MTDSDLTNPSVDPPQEVREPTVPEPARKESGFMRWILETVLMVAIAFLLAQGIKTFVVQPFIVPTGSMEPTIQINDRFLADKVSYHFGEPDQGDIVVFDDPQGRHPQLVKRIIATEGQQVDIRDGQVWVDGEPLSEPYLVDVFTDTGSVVLPVVVPEDHVWVMGDNRPNSEDSRYIGPQPISGIKGRAFAIYWPLAHLGGL